VANDYCAWTPRRYLHRRIELPLVVLTAWLVTSGVPVRAGDASDEWMRVIARLRVLEPATPPRIHAVQESVLQELANAPYRLVRRFDTLPFLVLEVSPAALALLRASSEVTAIEEDALSAPHPIPPQRPTPSQPPEKGPPNG
jgi:hypothetical protein